MNRKLEEMKKKAKLFKIAAEKVNKNMKTRGIKFDAKGGIFKFREIN